MNVYISILRGINVSGKKKIKMVELKAMYERMGFEDVVTYIQSGNVLFRAAAADLEEMAGRIRAEILETFGHEVPVLVLTKDYLEQVAARHPFIKTGEEPLNQLVVTFLASAPDRVLVEALADFVYKDDRFLIADQAVYAYCPGGYGTTKLSNNFFERKLKVTATTRNWKTVGKLVELGLGM